MAGTSLAQGITRLLAPTDKATALMEEFGIEIVRNSDGGLDLEETIKNLQVAFAGMSKETQVANAKVIFGQTALKGWLPLISASADEWDNLADKIKNSTGATEEMMNEMEKSGSFQFKIMQSAITDFLIVVGDALAPAMKDIAEMVTEMANKFSGWVTKMKETNPEMLSLIGKLGMLAVVLPPAIMMFGKLTSGLGNTFTATGTTIKAFTTFAKHSMMVAKGVEVTDGKVGLLAKGLGGLINTFGGTTVAIAGGVTALVGLGVAVGGNEKALTWLQDRWGVFGREVGRICEVLNGTFQMVFGNLGHLLVGLGKMIFAFLTGKWTQIDDIWRETWANMENTTAEAWSDMKAESTRAIAKIREASEGELSKLEKSFETVYGKITNLTVDNAGDVAKSLSDTVDGFSNDMLLMLRGTSDTMSVLLEGIDQSMSNKDITKKLKDNLESMASSGKYTASKIEADFKEAFELIQSNASTSSKRVESEVSKITSSLSRLAQDGVDNVAKNIHNIMSSMDSETYNTLRNMGDTWKALFDGVEQGSLDSQTKLLQNLKSLETDAEGIIDALNKELQSGFDETGKRIEETSANAQESLKQTSDAFAQMVEAIKENSANGMDEASRIFAEGLATLDAETVTSLMNTSDHWYSILSGTVDENGQLIEGFANQVLWNLGWVSEQTPEKLEGFKEGLLQALVEANLISAEQFEVLTGAVEESGETISEEADRIGENIKTSLNIEAEGQAFGRTFRNISTTVGEEAENISNDSIMFGKKLNEALDVEDKEIKLGNTFRNIAGSIATEGTNIVSESEKIGQGIDEGVSFEGTQQKVQEELNNINTTIAESGGTLSESAKASGEKARSSFLTGLTEASAQETALDTQLINEEHLMTQMELAGQKAISKFAESWVANSDVLTEALTLTLDMIGEQMSISIDGISLSMDGVNMKLALLNDTLDLVKNNIETLNRGNLGALMGSISNSNAKMRELITSTSEARIEANKLGKESTSGLTEQLRQSQARMIALKSDTTSTATEVKKLGDRKLNNLATQIDIVKKKVEETRNSVVNFINKIKDLNNQNLSGVTSRVSNLNSYLQDGINKAGSFKSRLQELNYVTFNNLINGLANVNSWLGTVRSNAYNTQTAVGSISTTRPRTIDSDIYGVGNYINQLYDTAPVNMAKYQTRGGYYTSNSLAGTGNQARKIQSQKEQLDLMQQQNDLLRQLLLATTNIGGDIRVSVDLDGKQVAKSTAKYMEKEISTLTKRKTRLGGNF